MPQYGSRRNGTGVLLAQCAFSACVDYHVPYFGRRGNRTGAITAYCIFSTKVAKWSWLLAALGVLVAASLLSPVEY